MRVSNKAFHRRFFGSLVVAVSLAAAMFVGERRALSGKCPNVQIVVERSASMGNLLDLFTKLSTVQGTFRFGLPLYDYFRLGLSGFPRTAMACDVDTAVL